MFSELRAIMSYTRTNLTKKKKLKKYLVDMDFLMTNSRQTNNGLVRSCALREKGGGMFGALWGDSIPLAVVAH